LPEGRQYSGKFAGEFPITRGYQYPPDLLAESFTELIQTFERRNCPTTWKGATFLQYTGQWARFNKHAVAENYVFINFIGLFESSLIYLPKG
jgi:hypothetical protein